MGRTLALLVFVHVLPASAGRYRPLSAGTRSDTSFPSFDGLPASTIAYTTSGLLGAIASPRRPLGPAGKPLPVISTHDLPPSVDFQSPEPGPPLLREYGVRSRS